MTPSMYIQSIHWMRALFMQSVKQPPLLRLATGSCAPFVVERKTLSSFVCSACGWVVANLASSSRTSHLANLARCRTRGFSTNGSCCHSSSSGKPCCYLAPRTASPWAVGPTSRRRRGREERGRAEEERVGHGEDDHCKYLQIDHYTFTSRSMIYLVYLHIHQAPYT